MVKKIGDGDPTDFDETRRLLYMALLRSRTEKYELAGTLVNALLHHHAVTDDQLSADDITDKVVDAIEGDSRAAVFLKQQIRRITVELGD